MSGRELGVKVGRPRKRKAGLKEGDGMAKQEDLGRARYV